MTRVAIKLMTAFAAIFACGSLLTAEEPKPSPTPTNWELQVKSTTPMRITADGKTYWYMIYTVVNNSGEDVPFHPDIVRTNDIENETPDEVAVKTPQASASMTVDPAIVGPSPSLYNAIKQRHAKTHPLLVTPATAIGTLRQGKDNAVTSVAIFPDMDARVSKFTIYFGGLSGERIMRPNPLYDAKAAAAAKARGAAADDPALQRVFVLQKTLAMPYTLPGDTSTRRTATPVLGKMDWVMR